MRRQYWNISILPALSLFFLSLIFAVVVSCSRSHDTGDRVVASVNNEPVTLKDFQQELALRSHQNPSYKITEEAIDDQLDTVIERRLMVQEAMKMGLARNEDFVRTIQTFWEQTLVRELIQAKNREWKDRIIATDDEVKEYYSMLKRTITFRAVRTDTRAEAEKALELARSGSMEGWNVVGPIRFGEAVGAYKDAFLMNQGDSGIVSTDDGYITLHVLVSQERDMQPLDTLYGQIKKSVINRKKTEVLENWLRDVREKAEIKINREVIQNSLGKESSEQDAQ